MSNGLQNVQNYLAPAIGTPRVFMLNQTFDPLAPVTQAFRNITGGMIDGQPFQPSGVFIDNTQGTAPLTVIINEMAYRMVCPAGESLSLPFPAPKDLSATITGTGLATVIFVDFPVIPYRSF